MKPPPRDGYAAGNHPHPSPLAAVEQDPSRTAPPTLLPPLRVRAPGGEPGGPFRIRPVPGDEFPAPRDRVEPKHAMGPATKRGQGSPERDAMAFLEHSSGLTWIDPLPAVFALPRSHNLRAVD